MSIIRRQRDIEENDFTINLLKNGWQIHKHRFSERTSPDAGPYTKGRVEEGVFRHYPFTSPETGVPKRRRIARDKEFPVTAAPAGRTPKMRTAEQQHYRRGKRRQHEKARRQHKRNATGLGNRGM
ncbi:hypothetical protein N7513_006831 [Penicillium frequentans]|nr:hypothetical protein N7513_006831 [Penicillium glabrum]